MCDAFLYDRFPNAVNPSQRRSGTRRTYKRSVIFSHPICLNEGAGSSWLVVITAFVALTNPSPSNRPPASLVETGERSELFRVIESGEIELLQARYLQALLELTPMHSYNYLCALQVGTPAAAIPYAAHLSSAYRRNERTEIFNDPLCNTPPLMVVREL
jgi:hypothetical protein